MKNKLLLFQLPVIILFTFAFWVTESGSQGHLNNLVLRAKVYPMANRLTAIFTDMKFKIRGPQAPKNKVVVIGVDSESIERVGRWPWHRDAQALLIDSVFEAGAKAVGLDIVYSETDKRVPDELAEVLRSKNLGKVVDQFETDPQLASVIARHRKNLVLGWTTENECQPLYNSSDECPVTRPDVLESHPKNFDKFAYGDYKLNKTFDPAKTPFKSLLTFIANIDDFNAVAEHSAYLNGFQDPDGYIRRSALFMMAHGVPFPSMAMEMVRIAKNDSLKLELKDNGLVRKLGFDHSGDVHVTPLGIMEINFRGPSYTFPYISALEVMGESDTIPDAAKRNLASSSKKELLKDAIVMIGVSAIGVFDMRAWPYDSNGPGVEIHANIIDNLLSGDELIPGSAGHGTGSILIFLFMVLGGIAFGYFTNRLEAVPALLLFLGVFGGTALIDMKVLFNHNLNWNTTFFYLEIGTILFLTVAAKYVMEERNKKFIRGAFTKYVSPAVVDSILKDPAKLSVGGEKKELTIMFSDIRSFTTFSERLDAKALAALLNDYLGVMTGIVFSHEGTLDKYIGDAIMAFWGAPLDQPKHAANACKTAVEMMKALNVAKAGYQQTYGVDVNIGIGINSGMVNVGNMGSTQNFAYTVIGDHVNLASRLESLTKYYGVSILTTRFTLKDIEGAGEPVPAHRVVDFVKVKGKKTAVEIIQVLDRDIDPKALAVFQEARELYSAQKWDAAIEKFQAAGKLLAQGDQADGPCEMYLERCRDFKAAPPEKDWDGSWEMHSK